MKNTGRRVEVSFAGAISRFTKIRTLFSTPRGRLCVRYLARGGHYVYYRVRHRKGSYFACLSPGNRV